MIINTNDTPRQGRSLPSLADIRAASERIAPYVHPTEVMTCASLDAMAGRKLFFKCENRQRGGAFKIRGAMNAALRLEQSVRSRGLLTHSSGNHAQAVAIAAKTLGVPAHIVMPEDAPAAKRAAVLGYGAKVYSCAPTLDARETMATDLQQKLGAHLIPPYDHADVIAGQGTVALELFGEVPDLDALVIQIGGGGLISGITLAMAELSPGCPIIGVEPRGADDAYRGKESGQRVLRHHPKTIADGLRTTLGDLTWPVVRDAVSEIVLVEEEEIVEATRLLMSRAKLVVEPSAAVGLAAVLQEAFQQRPGLERVGLVLSGGNLDLSTLMF